MQRGEQSNTGTYLLQVAKTERNFFNLSAILQLPQAVKDCDAPLDECTETATKDDGPKGNKRHNWSSL